PTFIGAEDDIKEYDNVDHNTGEYVEPVEPCDEEKEIRKKSVTVFIVDQVCPFHYLGSFHDLCQGLFSVQNGFFAFFVQIFCTDKNIGGGLETFHHFVQ